MKKTWVIGHKNPDTDSICAAIAYADLKNKTEEGTFEAKRAGHINEETQYVLDAFGVEAPEYVKDVGAQIKDITFRKTEGVSSHISIKRAWELMKQLDVVSLPIANAEHQLEGIVVTGDIAKSYMEVLDNRILATARTQYKNIIDTLNGKLVTGNEHGYFVKGKVVSYPFKALTCSFKLCKIVIVTGTCTYNCGNHSRSVNNALVNNG